MTFLKLEFAAIVAVIILLTRLRPRLAKVPFLLKVAHFTFVCIFAVIGIDGFNVLLLACIDSNKYIEVISHPNPFGMSVSSFKYVGYEFAAVGSVLCLAALRLGALKNWGRKTLICLALPYSLSYSYVMFTIYNSAQLPGADHLVKVITIILSMASIFAVGFYVSKPVAKYFALE